MQENKKFVVKKTHSTSTGSGNIKPSRSTPVSARLSSRPASRKSGTSGGQIAVIIIVVLVVAGGVGGGVHVYKTKQQDARRAAIALSEKKSEADAVFNRMPKEISRMEKLTAEANVHFSAVKDIVLFVTGTTYGAKPVKMALTAATPEKLERPRADGNAAKRAAPVAAPTSSRSEAQDASKLAEELGIPEGVMTIEEMENLRAEKNGVSRTAPVAEPTPARPASQEMSSSGGDLDIPAGVMTRDELEGLRADRDVGRRTAPGAEASPADRGDSSRHQGLLDLAGKVAADVGRLDLQRSQLMELQPGADERYSEAMHAKVLPVVAAAVIALDTQVQTASNLVEEAIGILKEIETFALDARKMQEEEVRIREARAEASRLQREADELRERTAKEVQRAESMGTFVKDPISRFAFAEALAAVEQVLPELTTDAGREALSFPLERVRRLQRLKTRLIDRLNNKPFRWGWGTTASSSQDILGADENGIRIPTGAVAWADISTAQMQKIIKYLANDETLRASDKADDSFAAALLFDEQGKKYEAGKELENALLMNNLLRNEARRLLPDYK